LDFHFLKNKHIFLNIKVPKDINMLTSKSFKVNPSDDLMADIFTLTNVQPVLN